MKILLTGASGFLGSYIMKEFDAPVLSLGKGKSNSISCDLAEEIPVIPQVDLVIHNAGLAHRIPKTPEEERKFYKVNLFGTQNLLKGLDSCPNPPKSFVFISTVAVYGLESGEMISEMITPKPQTPYGKSKYEAELLLHNWASHHKVNLVILRLPLIAGAKNTPGNLGAMIRAIQRGYYFRIGEGKSRKSMVLASDIAAFLTKLDNHHGVYNLTDGVHPTIAELDTYLSGHFGRKVKSLPKAFLQKLCKIGDVFSAFPLNSYRMAKLNESLTFDDSKARKELGWNPKPVLGNFDF